MFLSGERYRHTFREKDIDARSSRTKDNNRCSFRTKDIDSPLGRKKIGRGVGGGEGARVKKSVVGRPMDAVFGQNVKASERYPGCC